MNIVERETMTGEREAIIAVRKTAVGTIGARDMGVIVVGIDTITETLEDQIEEDGNMMTVVTVGEGVLAHDLALKREIEKR